MGTFPGKPDQNPRDKGKGFCNFVGYLGSDSSSEIDEDEEFGMYSGEEFDEETIEEILDEHLEELFGMSHGNDWKQTFEEGSEESLEEIKEGVHEDSYITRPNEREEAMGMEVHQNLQETLIFPQAEVDKIQEELSEIHQKEVDHLAQKLREHIDDADIEEDLSEDQGVIINLLHGTVVIKEAARMVTDACFERLFKRTLVMQTDPGKFTIPVKIEKTVFRGICDLGSNVNVMPASLFNKLEVGFMKRRNREIVLADGSSTQSLGVTEGIIVMVEKIRILVDFIILTYDKEPPDPLILGRPFLRSGGALIDTLKDTIQFRVGGKTLTFEMKEERKKKKKAAKIHAMNEPPDDPRHQHTSKEMTPISHEPP